MTTVRALLVGSLFLVACHDHDELDPACETIHTACASFHDGTGAGHDCHEVAAANDAAQCTAQTTACLAACQRDMSVASDLSKQD